MEPKRRTSFLLFLAASLAACNDPIPTPKGEPPRFVAHIATTIGSSGVYLITDTKTGREFLAPYKGGLTEVLPR